ncbi:MULTISPECIES: hypothetical protein [unclassified Moraxella]|uniref:hypothetical protein n=1 Tax=unclassified Moraxella TaxID=2685852 RepID=UPI003AF9E569
MKLLFDQNISFRLIMPFMLLVLCFSNTSFAHTYPNVKTTCYQFNANKLAKQQSCTIESGGGAGGETEIMRMGKNSYQFDTVWDYDEKTQQNDVHYQYTIIKGNRWVSQPAELYFRNAKTLKIDNDEKLSIYQMLTCYRTQDNKLDLCHANPK